MKTLFDPVEVESIKTRIERLTADSQRQWGKMSVEQMVAHLRHRHGDGSRGNYPPRMLIGRLLGGIIKLLALKVDAPMRKNSSTAPSLVVNDAPDLETERSRLRGLNRSVRSRWSCRMYKASTHVLWSYDSGGMGGADA